MGVVGNRDSNFAREIAVFSYPQAGVVTGLCFELIPNHQFTNNYIAINADASG